MAGQVAPTKAGGPGSIDNRMMQSLGSQLAGDEAAALRSGVESSIALRRYGTNEEEVAHRLAFLGSDASSYCTGSNYMVDGGYIAA